MDNKTYKIIRFYKDDNTPNEIIETGLTKDEARSHCQNKDSQKEGVYFDGMM